MSDRESFSDRGAAQAIFKILEIDRKNAREDALFASRRVDTIAEEVRTLRTLRSETNTERVNPMYTWWIPYVALIALVIAIVSVILGEYRWKRNP